MSAPMLAAHHGLLPTLQLMLACGVSPEAALEQESSPIIAACVAGQAESLRVLLRAGADPNRPDANVSLHQDQRAASLDDVHGGADARHQSGESVKVLLPEAVLQQLKLPASATLQSPEVDGHDRPRHALCHCGPRTFKFIFLSYVTPALLAPAGDPRSCWQRVTGLLLELSSDTALAAQQVSCPAGDQRPDVRCGQGRLDVGRHPSGPGGGPGPHRQDGLHRSARCRLPGAPAGGAASAVQGGVAEQAVRAHLSCRGVLRVQMDLLQHLRVCRGAARCCRQVHSNTVCDSTLPSVHGLSPAALAGLLHCSSVVLAGRDDQGWGVLRGLLPAHGRFADAAASELFPELNKQVTASRSAQAVRPCGCYRLWLHL